MQIITTDFATIPDPQVKQWVYCGLDTCITEEVRQSIYPRLNENNLSTYKFEMACHGPALTMQLRGIKIDDNIRKQNIKDFLKESKQLKTECQEFASQYDFEFNWGKGMPPSTQQLQKLLYGKMGIKVEKDRKTKQPTANKEALERIRKKNSKARPICDLALKLRDLQKMYEIMEKGISSDRRFRFTMAVGQTNTGRASSYKDIYAMGDNIQNKDKRIRNMFIPDPGCRMVNIDLEQAESRVIAYVSGDENYIQAHEAGNVHVTSADVFWPDFCDSTDVNERKAYLKHTPAHWVPQPKPVAGALPAFSYYDMSKRAQHGLNYGLSYQGLATWIGSKQDIAQEYHARYFNHYPNILKYHNYVAMMLSNTGTLTTPLGMERRFFGLSWDRKTIREAIAYVPQSTVGQICWLGIYRIWKDYDPHNLQILQNGHDSGLFQVPNESLSTLVPLMKDAMTITFDVTDKITNHTRSMTIPVDCAIGTNWQECC